MTTKRDDNLPLPKLNEDEMKFFGIKEDTSIAKGIGVNWESTTPKIDVAIGGTYKAPTTEKALRFNKGKLDWSLVPFDALEEMVKVLQFGADKYAPGNWAKGEGLSYRETISCMLRHTFALLRMEDHDPESKLHHIGHVQCNALFLAYMIKYPHKFTRDDRLNLLGTVNG